MSYLKQSYLDLVYKMPEGRREAGRATRQKISALKSKSAYFLPRVSAFDELNRGVCSIFCLLFRPKFIERPKASKPAIFSEKTG